MLAVIFDCPIKHHQSEGLQAESGLTASIGAGGGGVGTGWGDVLFLPFFFLTSCFYSGEALGAPPLGPESVGLCLSAPTPQTT